MARPSIPEERYEQAINQLIADGNAVDQLTATKLQAAVGGRYSRAAEILKAFQDQHAKTEQAEKPRKPQWFGDFQQALLNQTDKLWNEIVSPEIQHRYEQAAKETEQVREEARRNRHDDFQQITRLEEQSEEQSDELTRLREQLVSEKARLEQAEDLHQKALKDQAGRIADLMLELDAERRKVASLEAGKEQLEQQLADTQESLIIIREEQQSVTSELNTARQDNSRLSGQLELIQEQLANKTTQNDGLQEKLDNERQGSSSLKAQVEQKDNQIAELRDRVASLESGKQDLADRLSESEKAGSRLDGELTSVKEQKAQLESKVEGCLAQLEEAREINRRMDPNQNRK